MEDSTSQILLKLPPERRWHQQSYPAPIVVALIRRTINHEPGADPISRYLLIKRSGEPYSDCWALVGGKWEFGEALSEAIIREVQEETGLNATFVAVRGLVSERVIPAGDEAIGAHYLLFVSELLADVGVAEEKGEGAIGWFTRAEIDHLHDAESIIPSDYAMINSFAEAGHSMPHVEAEMHAAFGDASDAPTQLLRYEHINNLKSSHEP